MIILGISAFYHDSAAALIVDGRIVAAAQEERFTRIKHDLAFPRQAIDYCLAEAGVEIEEIDYVAFYEKPLLKFERLLETYLSYAPKGLRNFREALPQWAKQKLFIPREIKNGLDKRFGGRIAFPAHHESHAASAFYPSPFEEAAILTIDGVGEWDTTTIGVGKGSEITLRESIRFPHSLGLLYSAFTYYTGFRVNSGEYKLMGLAPYGRPIYADLIREHLIDLKPDGSFRLQVENFTFCESLRMTGKRFEKIFGQPRRTPESPLEEFHMDVAASVQVVTEEAVLALAKRAYETSGGCPNLVMAGGVALNCVANGRVLRESPFENIWIQPASGDAGGALGAALLVWHQLLENPRTVSSPDGQSGTLLGPSYSSDHTTTFLDQAGATYTRFDTPEELATQVADLLAAEKVVGLHQGRMEFGPRALGSRSIIGDARSEAMQKTMNLKIKFRESFRPFAPAVLREDVDQYFEMRPEEDSPYMLLVAPVAKSQHTASDESDTSTGLDQLNQTRSTIPAVTHVDHSARVQTIDPIRHPDFHSILTAFKEKTGSPVLINTSFNVRGEPIVNTPEDAYRCFLGTNMDALVIGNCLLIKEDQTNAPEIDQEAYLSQFALD